MAGFSSNGNGKGIGKKMRRRQGTYALSSGSVYVTTPERLANVNKLLEQYSDVMEKLKAAKLWGEKLDQMEMERRSKGLALSDRPLDELNLEELVKLRSQCMEFKEKLINYEHERNDEVVASTSISSGGSNDPLDGSGGSSDEPDELSISPI